ncbi:hypothetical protein C1I98_11435 [Spongiactinospora gelatinilytica]|uniref:SAM-dependent methyltransferase n=1 Tax=Spongiactinospora gelatinilytica TaxID=2666298 RepID=A0A2W2HHH9_9ACTN|nr:SAM-dependent methyltransferase [Spongiactinospora gelatinilytica]PZG49790.1 hypothetical protein C1I98_11435 [Spongiactinospora gelatinilytica]
MIEREQAPAGVDPTVPSVARIYDHLLGGKDNFAADREAAAQIVRLSPNAKDAARANRAFLGRAVRVLAEIGIDQYLDIGTGLPTQDNVHQVARRSGDASKVVYVDNDPIVLTHARALLAETPDTIVVKGDMREPKAILGHPEVAAHLDFRRPLAVLMVAVLHFLPDDEQVQGIIRTIRDSVPSGGYLVISHVTAGDLDREVVAEGRRLYSKTTAGNVTLRGRDQIAALFEGLELLEPGLVAANDWRGDVALDPSLSGPGGVGVLCGVGRVP